MLKGISFRLICECRTHVKSLKVEALTGKLRGLAYSFSVEILSTFINTLICRGQLHRWETTVGAAFLWNNKNYFAEFRFYQLYN